MSSTAPSQPSGHGQGRETPLLITLDLHKHREIARCVQESAELFSHYGQRATYFVPAGYLRMYDSLTHTLRRVREMGHDVGCHGLNHTPDEDLGLLPPDREFALLREATSRLEDGLGAQVTSFRAPCYRISQHTLRALDELGYKADLSMTPQQVPILSSAPWTMGRLLAPRSPYHPSKASPWRRGDLRLLEIPTSCFLVPFAQATVLALPVFSDRLMRPLLAFEARRFKRPLVLQLHPESVVGKDDWKFPPLQWRDFLPARAGGFKFRYKLIERDPVKVKAMTDRLLAGLRSEADLKSVSVTEYLANGYVT